jgi:hypothetical protein
LSPFIFKKGVCFIEGYFDIEFQTNKRSIMCDLDETTPEERLKEVAKIMARGYLRLKKRTPYLPELATEDRQNPDIHVPQDIRVKKESSAVYQERT